jgi:hypothetical protein
MTDTHVVSAETGKSNYGPHHVNVTASLRNRAEQRLFSTERA